MCVYDNFNCRIYHKSYLSWFVLTFVFLIFVWSMTFTMSIYSTHVVKSFNIFKYQSICFFIISNLIEFQSFPLNQCMKWFKIYPWYPFSWIASYKFFCHFLTLYWCILYNFYEFRILWHAWQPLHKVSQFHVIRMVALVILFLNLIK